MTSIHTYHIDQSIKIENTSKTSYISLTNSQSLIVSISAGDKRQLKRYFRDLGKPLVFKVFTFSVLCAKALMQSGVSSVTIDEEYTGHGHDIHSFITQVLLIESKEKVHITFKRIGKLSSAHEKVHSAMKRKQSGIRMKASEILRYFNNIDKP